MKTVLAVAALTLASLFAAPVMARGSVPIVNIENVAITTGSGKPATLEQIRQAFITGGARHGWTFTQNGDGKLVANLNVRNKHTVVAEVSYSIDKYSVVYQSSVNMNYEAKDGGLGVIHPKYGMWVQNLLAEVRAELTKL